MKVRVIRWARRRRSGAVRWGAMKVTDPLTYYRQRAEDLARFAPPAAEAYEDAAAVFERWLEGQQLEPLDLATAEVESGYTRSHLRRMLKDGTIRNAGTKEGPRILRAHLPRKPGYGVPPDDITIANARRGGASSPSQAVRAIAAGG
jgi:hypothetical protein